ncbi:MAG TPA: S8 family serine peptidase [Thermoanaerobaculia bacterium]|nr:S8 family serine peptidase [Thermoanaerobaculia bacterium]
MSGTGEARTILLAIEEIPPWPGESWRAYGHRVAQRLTPLRHRAEQAAGLELTPLLAANGFCGQATEEAILRIRAGVLGPEVSLIEWGEELPGGQMHSAVREVGLGRGAGVASPGHNYLTGRGVSVAVLDSGIDARHPWLAVEGAVSTCPEPAGVPGWHGTHCAGLIASRSPRYLGLAPGVRLLDVKVSRAGGWLHPAWFARGIDAALDLNADILSISLGFNRLPANVANGHGWNCADGRCLLCRAVDHAVLVGTLVVAAAGNEHLRVRGLRNRGVELQPAAELLCPASARRALAVGALETWPKVRLWPHSSWGRRGSDRPELLAPGVDLASTVPVREDGRVLDNFALFGTGTGTSAAAAVTAGAAALIRERRCAAGLSPSPRAIRRELLARCLPLLSPDGRPSRRLDLSSLGLSRPEGEN